MSCWNNLKIVDFPFDEKNKHCYNKDYFHKKASPPNVYSYIEAIRDSKDEVYIITSSAILSPSYEKAKKAVETYTSNNKDKKIHIFNSYGFGGVMAILAIKIHELAQSGKPFKSVVTLSQYFCANKIVSYTYLKRNDTNTVCRKNIIYKKYDDGAYNQLQAFYRRKKALSKLEKEVSSIVLNDQKKEAIAIIEHNFCDEEIKALNNFLEELNITKIIISPYENDEDKNKFSLSLAI